MYRFEYYNAYMISRCKQKWTRMQENIPLNLSRQWCQIIQPGHQSKALREPSGSVVECLIQDREAPGSSLTGVTALCPWARHINPSLAVVQPRKTRPYITERLLMERKESNQPIPRPCLPENSILANRYVAKVRVLERICEVEIHLLTLLSKLI